MQFLLARKSPLFIIIELFLRFDIPAEDIFLEIPGQHPPVMIDVLGSRDGEHLIKLFQ